MSGGYTVVMPRWVVVNLISIILVVCSCGSAEASNRGVAADIRCVVVAMRMFSGSTPQQRGEEMMLAMYYFGRLDAESQGVDIQRLIEDQTAKMTPAQLRTNATRCGRALVAKGQEIERIGLDISRKTGRGAAEK